MIHFIFCHGFGFNCHFWDNLAPYFSKEKCSFIDLGYFKKPSILPLFEGQKIVGIGHSMGLLKLAQLYESFDCLIGLNSFIDFLGKNQILYPKRQLELKALKRSLIKDPTDTLKQFYARCGVPEFEKYTSPDRDINLMLCDLDLLKLRHSLPMVPTLILASNNDPVVPHELIDENFLKQSNVQTTVLTDSQHALGHKKSEEAHKIIMSFLNVIFKE